MNKFCKFILENIIADARLEGSVETIDVKDPLGCGPHHPSPTETEITENTLHYNLSKKEVVGDISEWINARRGYIADGETIKAKPEDISIILSENETEIEYQGMQGVPCEIRWVE